MANPFAPAQIDFSPLGDIGGSIGGAISNRMDNSRYKDAFAQATGPDGTTDYNKLTSILGGMGDMKGAAAAAAIRDKIEGASNRFGLQPQFDDQGNAYQLYSGGGASPLELPDGRRLQQPTQWIQTPQGVYPRNRFGGGDPSAVPNQAGGSPPAGVAPGVGPIVKDYVGPEAEKVEGDVMGKALAALPAAEAMASRVIGAITRVEKSPSLKNAIGTIQSRLPTFSDNTANVEADIEQVIGGVFTSVYESLKGAQAITDIEGAKATAAVTRVQNMKQSEPGYRDTLSDAKYEIFQLVNIVRKKAGQPPQPNPFKPPKETPNLFDGSPSETSGVDAGGWTDLGNGVRIRQK